MADRAYGFSADGVRQIREDHRRLNGEPVNRRLARARYPVASGSSLTAFKITGSETYTDAADVESTTDVAIWRCKELHWEDGIKARRVKSIEDCTAGVEDSEDADVDIYGQTHHGVFVTGDVVMVKSLFGRKQIVSTGATYWAYAVALEDFAVGGTGTVSLDSSSGSPIVTATNLTDGGVSAGTQCRLFFDDKLQAFQILNISCPVYLTDE